MAQEGKKTNLRILLPILLISFFIFLGVLIYNSRLSSDKSSTENLNSNTSPNFTPTPTGEDVSSFFNYSQSQKGSFQGQPPTGKASKNKVRCNINGQDVVEGNVNTDTICIK